MDHRLTSYRRDNPLEKIKKRLEPKRTLPVGALPQWEALPLDKKIPAVPAPEGAVIFTRGKLAQPVSNIHKTHHFNSIYKFIFLANSAGG